MGTEVRRRRRLSDLLGLASFACLGLAGLGWPAASAHAQQVTSPNGAVTIDLRGAERPRRPGPGPRPMARPMARLPIPPMSPRLTSRPIPNRPMPRRSRPMASPPIPTPMASRPMAIRRGQVLYPPPQYPVSSLLVPAPMGSTPYVPQVAAVQPTQPMTPPATTAPAATAPAPAAPAPAADGHGARRPGRPEHDRQRGHGYQSAAPAAALGRAGRFDDHGPAAAPCLDDDDRDRGTTQRAVDRYHRADDLDRQFRGRQHRFRRAAGPAARRGQQRHGDAPARAASRRRRPPTPAAEIAPPSAPAASGTTGTAGTANTQTAAIPPAAPVEGQFQIDFPADSADIPDKAKAELDALAQKMSRRREHAPAAPGLCQRHGRRGEPGAPHVALAGAGGALLSDQGGGAQHAHGCARPRQQRPRQPGGPRGHHSEDDMSLGLRAGARGAA